MEGETVVEVSGLYTWFGQNVIHEDLALSVRRGEILGLVGGSGTGKSVLVNTIIGLKQPNAGSVRVLGLDPHATGRSERAQLQQRWGVLFQSGALFSGLTVRENVSIPLNEHTHLPAALVQEIADAKIDMVGLPREAADRTPSELSGGMKKRAGLARALALDPEILFLDEPTAGLDPIGASAFDSLILSLQQNLKLTVVLVTHDLDTLAAICNRIAVLLDRKTRVGTLAELMAMDHPWLHSYFHGPRMRAALAAPGRRGV